MTRKETAGRSLLLTKEVITDFEKWVGLGMNNVDVATLLGFSESTVYLWLSNSKDPSKDPLYAEFAMAMERGKAKFKATHIANITKAAKQERHWQASAWLLERRFPDEYGRREKMDMNHSGNIGNPYSGLTEEQLRRLAGDDDDD